MRIGLLILLAILAPPPGLPSQDPAPVSDVDRRIDLTFWESIKDTRDPDLFRDYLNRFPKGVFVTIAKARLRELEKAAEKPAVPESLPATPSGPADRRPALLAQVHQAMGGLDRLRSVRSYLRVQQSTGKNVFGKDWKSPKSTLQWCATGETRFSDGGGERFFNGKDRGWTAVKGKLRMYGPTFAANSRAYQQFDVVRLLSSPAQDLAVSADGNTLRFRDAAGNERSFEIDPATGLPVRSTLTFTDLDPDGTASHRNVSVLRLEDWRRVGDGVRLPFREVVESATPPVQHHILEWKINPAEVSCAALGKEPAGAVRVIDPPREPARLPAQPRSSEDLPAAGVDTSAEARAVLGRLQEAMGGVDRLLSARDFRRTFQDRSPDFSGREKKGRKITETWCETGQYLQRVSIPLLADLLLYFDGADSGWVVRGSKHGKLPAGEVEDLKRTLFDYDVFNLVLADRRPGTTLSLLAANRVQAIDPNGSVATIEVDPATNLPVRKTSQYFTRNGVSPVVETRLSDWRGVGGLRLPFRAEEFVRGRKRRTASVLDWRVNMGTDCSRLGDPAYAGKL